MSKRLSYCYVKIWGNTVGVVAWSNNQAFFEYDPQFIQGGLELSPLHMPLSKEIYSFPYLENSIFHGLPGMLANSIPDTFGKKVTNTWLKSQGIQRGHLNPIERLCFIGKRGMGALEFYPCSSSEIDKVVHVETQQLASFAKRAFNNQININNTSSASDHNEINGMLDLVRVGTSAGGAVPKAIVSMQKDGTMRSGQAQSGTNSKQYILKFDSINTCCSDKLNRPVSSTRLEYAYHLMAKAAGINMMPSSLFHDHKGGVHFITERFDRVAGEKKHVLNFSAITHRGWDHSGLTAYEDLFETMRALKIPHREQEEQFRRMLFNVFTRNTDDHVKQFSFIMEKSGKWHITPAYDITFAYNPNIFSGERHKMSINSKVDNFETHDFIEFAEKNDINKAQAIIDDTIAAVNLWPNHAKEADLDKETCMFVHKSHIESCTFSVRPYVVG